MTNNEKRAAALAEKLSQAPKGIYAEVVILEALNAAQAEGYKQGAESKWLPIESAPKGEE